MNATASARSTCADPSSAPAGAPPQQREVHAVGAPAPDVRSRRLKLGDSDTQNPTVERMRQKRAYASLVCAATAQCSSAKTVSHLEAGFAQATVHQAQHTRWPKAPCAAQPLPHGTGAQGSQRACHQANVSVHAADWSRRTGNTRCTCAGSAARPSQHDDPAVLPPPSSLKWPQGFRQRSSRHEPVKQTRKS